MLGKYYRKCASLVFYGIRFYKDTVKICNGFNNGQAQSVAGAVIGMETLKPAKYVLQVFFFYAGTCVTNFKDVLMAFIVRAVQGNSAILPVIFNGVINNVQ